MDALKAAPAIMSGHLKGMALGASNAIAVVALIAACDSMGAPAVMARESPKFEAVFFALLIVGLPVGVFWGLLIGSMTHGRTRPPWLRAIAYVLGANLAMLVSGGFVFPAAFIPTTIHALLLARWMQPRSMELAEELDEPARPLTDLQKGMLLGASNALASAIACSLCVALELGYRPSHRDAVDVLLVIALAGIPIGVLVGGTVGAILEAVEWSRRVRIALHVVFGFLVILLFTAWWPQFGMCAIPSTLMHGVLLARWTRPPVRVPAMRIVRMERRA